MPQEKWLTDLYWTSPHNYLEEIQSQFTLPADEKVAIHDVTLREGEQTPGVPAEIHGHNNHGLATAVMLSVAIGGASVVHTSINGVGERGGNAATEEVALALELLLDLDTGTDLSRLYEISLLVQDLTKFKVAPNKPAVGDNLFCLRLGSPISCFPRQLKREDQRPSSRLCLGLSAGTSRGTC